MLDHAFTLDDRRIAIVVGAADGIAAPPRWPTQRRAPPSPAPTSRSPRCRATAADIEAVGGRALPVLLDVTDGASCHAAVAATVARFGGLDVLMYGPATGDQAGDVLDMDEATWDTASSGST